MNENLTPYPADDGLRRAKAETDELKNELKKLRQALQATKEERQRIYFQAFLGKSVNDYQRGFFDGYIAGLAETLVTRLGESDEDE